MKMKAEPAEEVRDEEDASEEEVNPVEDLSEPLLQKNFMVMKDNYP